MIRRIDINCDLGESTPTHSAESDRFIMPYISSCNIACGFHAGDPSTIKRTILWAKEHNVSIGAHPSYDDREGFGRRPIEVDPDVLMAQILYQVSAMKGMAESLGCRLHHVKPHGALYHALCYNKVLGTRFLEIIKSIEPTIVIYGASLSPLAALAAQAGVGFMHEVFADRAYTANGTLAPRQIPGAIITDTNEIGDQILGICLHGEVTSIEGVPVNLKADTLCVHSDTPGAIQIVRHIQTLLMNNDVRIQAN